MCPLPVSKRPHYSTVSHTKMYSPRTLRAVLIAGVVLLGYLKIEGLGGASAGYVMRCPPSDEDSTIHRLKSTLLCNYDLEERPVANRSANVTVAISLEIKRIYIGDVLNQNSIRAWFTLSWKDEHLQWDPAKYENITEFQLPSSMIWTPDLAIYNAEADHMKMFSGVRCLVRRFGTVICVPTVSAPISCEHDATSWPFDRRVCQAIVGSWNYHGAQLDLELYYNGYTKFGYVLNPEWELQSLGVSKKVEFYPCCPKEPYVSMHYALQLRRHAGLYAAAIVVPAFVLAGVVLTSFWIRDATPRALTCLTAVLGNANFLLYLSQKLPSDGDTRPIIVAFYRDAMLVSALSLCVAMISARLEASQGALWLGEVTAWIHGRSGRPGQLLLGDIYAEQEKDQTVEGGNASRGSSNFAAAAVLDRLSFLAFGVAYIILLSALLP